MLEYYEAQGAGARAAASPALRILHVMQARLLPHDGTTQAQCVATWS